MLSASGACEQRLLPGSLPEYAYKSFFPLPFSVATMDAKERLNIPIMTEVRLRQSALTWGERPGSETRKDVDENHAELAQTREIREMLITRKCR